jgi:hypothetical protein
LLDRVGDVLAADQAPERLVGVFALDSEPLGGV